MSPEAEESTRELLSQLETFLTPRGWQSVGPTEDDRVRMVRR